MSGRDGPEGPTQKGRCRGLRFEAPSPASDQPPTASETGFTYGSATDDGWQTQEGAAGSVERGYEGQGGSLGVPVEGAPEVSGVAPGGDEDGSANGDAVDAGGSWSPGLEETGSWVGGEVLLWEGDLGVRDGFRSRLQVVGLEDGGLRGSVLKSLLFRSGSHGDGGDAGLAA